MATATDTDPVFTVTRTFNAPRALVWKAFTEAERLAAWFGPKGMPIERCTLDLTPGGLFHYSMKTPGGLWWGRWRFEEVTAPERLVFVSSFSDEDGGVTKAPFPGDFPKEVRSIIEFIDEGDRTTLSMRGTPVDGTPAERAFFEGMFASMNQGWGGTFEQLEQYLAGA